MNTIKYFFGLLIIIGLLSCEKADVEIESSGVCYIKSISNFDNIPEHQYDFDAKGNLVEARVLGTASGDFPKKYEYFYNSKNKIEAISINDSIYSSFIYENEILVKNVDRNKKGYINSIKTIVQNPSTKLIDKYILEDVFGISTHIFTYDSEGNCTKIEGFNEANKPLYKRTYSGFVNGKNALTSLKGHLWGVFSGHYIGGILVYDAPLNFGKPSKYATEIKTLIAENNNFDNPNELKERFSTQFKYIFNENGYVTSSQEYNITGGKTATLNGERNYIYSSCN